MDACQQDIALFRYSLIREAADPELTPTERGQLVRQLARKVHAGPDGARVRVSRSTLDRWIRAYRASGYHGLVPEPRVGVRLTPGHILDAAAVLKRENPSRAATHISVMLAEAGHSVSPRTLQRFFVAEGLNLIGGPSPRQAFGRFEAEVRNVRWTGDAMHGRFRLDGRKPVLFAFIDDHSRLIPGSRWAFSEDTIRLEAALRGGLAARGVPASVYVDNGSPFVSRQLERACAVLGARLIHSKPGQPEGRGKIERFFRTVRADFEIEVGLAEPTDLADLNRLFHAWLEQVYHRRPHTETGEPPLQRFETNGPPQLPTPELLREAFLWSEHRTVTATATVSMHANTYQVDAALIGRKIELVFDPFDLTDIETRLGDRPMGRAVPHKIGRHTHPQAQPDEPQTPPPASGIDYLRLLDTRHREHTQTRINYAHLDDQIDGQLQPPDTDTEEDQP